MPTPPQSVPAIWTCSIPTKDGLQLGGNREGLRRLRQAIDSALESGAADCDQMTCDWTEVRMYEEWPGKRSNEVRGLRYYAALVVVATVVGTLMLVFGLGFHAIVSWWK